ncbi:putative MFS transporter [Arcanobacterium pluranimalium]|uniref:MFS transporter n=1 Tax=Arcanobacterium pluranimalium TaxID=108028 RepID=UPI001EF979CE|nr:MFS transporter [Arcanobacterium pluranimalium]MBM7824244.1 putative MFS transporter [Arcanobacterium pluranimalium]
MSLTAMEQVDTLPLTRNQKSLIGLTIVGNISEFFDLFLIGFVIHLLMTTPGWQLTGFEAGVIGAASGIGTVLGAILWGRLADMIGRKKAFIWCIGVLVFFTAITLTIQPGQWQLLSLYRIGVCIGVGGLNITSIPFVQEFVPAKQRGLLSGLTSVFIPLGIFLGSLATKVLGEPFGWKGLIALGCVPVVLIAWAALVPESPRFLIAQGKIDEARKAYAWAMNIPESEVGALPSDTAEKATKNASYGFVLRKYPKQLVIISLGSFCFILGAFTVQSWGQSILGESFKFDVSTVAYMFMGVSLADLLGRLGSAWISDRIGRRRTMFIWGLIGAVGCVIAAISAKVASGMFSGGGAETASTTHTAGIVFFIGIVIAMAFGDGAFGILNAFGAEQFPNDVRSTGVGLGYGIGAIAKVVGPYFVGALIGGGKPTPDVVFLPFVIFAVLLVAGGFIYLQAEETAGKQLEQIG